MFNNSDQNRLTDDFSKIKSGAVLIDRYAFWTAIELLEGRRLIKKTRRWAFTCLLQLIESIVLHEKIYFSSKDDSVALALSFKHTHQFAFETLSGTPLELASEIFGQIPSADELPEAYLPTFKLDSYKDKQYLGQDLTELTTIIARLAFRPAPERRVIGPEDSQRVQQLGKSYYINFADEALKRISDQAQNEVNDLSKFLNEEQFKIEMPIISMYILSKRPSNLIEAAMEVRESKEARAFRNVCTAFDLAASVGDYNEMYRLKNEMTNVIEKLSNKYGESNLEVNIMFPLAVEIDVTKILGKVLNRRRQHLLIFIDDLYNAALRSRDLRDVFYRYFN